ncbi:MAG: hypothetical protein V4689_22805 [Verrucomicrobiota bacterium]
MFKLITAAVFALVISITSVQAGPSKRIFKGDYDGYTLMEDLKGNRIYYSPVRLKISKAGVISGTAYNDATDKLIKVSGSITKVKVLFGIRYLGTASGTFADGTKWKAEIEANKGVSGKIFNGKATKGRYSGEIKLTN